MHSWLDGWDHRIKLTIHKEKIGEDLTDFPVMVYLRSTITGTAPIFSGFSALGASDYYKIAVALPNALQCPVEVERFDIAGGVIVLHFKAPAMSSTEDNIFYLYYDSTHADNTDYVGLVGDSVAEGVWDDYFYAVYHATDDPSTGAPQLTDSTGNGRDGTAQGTMTAGDLVNSDTGSKAIDFDGTDDYFTIPSLPTDDYPTGLSVEAVFKLTSLTNARVLFSQGQKFHTTDMFDLRYESNALRMGSRVDNYSDWDEVTTEFTDTSDYHYVIGGYDTGAGELKIGLDGAVYSASACTRYNQYENYGALGRQTKPTDYEYYGGIAEVRLSSIMRSEAWSLATYYTLLDSNFISFEWENYPLWMRGYKECLQIVIDPTVNPELTSDLTDFPVTLFINSSAGIDNQNIARMVRTLGEDRFKFDITDNNGTSLYVEIDVWDVENEQAILYVKVPTISATELTYLNLYFDPSVADNTTYVGNTGSTAAQNVWNSNYLGVWHFSQESGDFLDSTSYEADLSAPAGVFSYAQPAQGGSADGNLAWDMTSVTTAAKATGVLATSWIQNCTFEIMCNPVVTSGLKYIIRTNKMGLRQDSTAEKLQHWRSHTYFTAISANGAFTEGWHHYTGTFSSDQKHSLYKDMTTLVYDSYQYYSQHTATSDGTLTVLSAADASAEQPGAVSEARIMNVRKRPNWIKTTYLALTDALVTYVPMQSNYEGSWLPGWRKRAKITIDKDMFAVPEQDYNLVIQLDATTGSTSVDATEIFDDLSDESLKIAFTLSNGHKQCYAEVNSWDDTGEVAVVTVTVPYISELADTVLYLYWDANIDDNTVFVSEYADTPTPEDIFEIDMGPEDWTPLTSMPTGDADWLSGFSNRLPLYIDVRDYTEDFTDFPMALTLSDDCLGGRDYSSIPIALGNNPYKIAVTLADGTTQCYVENAYLDETNGVLELYFKISLLSTDTIVDVFLYYDSAATDNTTYVGLPGETVSQNVWSNNYHLVFHFNEDASATNPKDSSANRTMQLVSGFDAADLVTGHAEEKALYFDGVNNRLQTPDVGGIRLGYRYYVGTIEAVLKRGSGAGSTAYRDTVLRQRKSATASHNGGFWINESSDVLLWYSNLYDAYSIIESTGTVPKDGGYHYIACAADHAADSFRFRIDGSQEDKSGYTDDDNTYDYTHYGCIGHWYDRGGWYHYESTFSEIRVSGVQRSHEWMELTQESLFGTIYSADLYSYPTEPAWYKFNGVRPCKRLQMTIDADDVGSPLTDYDLQVTVNYNRLAGTTDADTSGFWQEIAEGGDAKSVVFTTEDGTVLTARYSDFDTTDKEATYWVTVPSISDTEDTVLVMYYDHTVVNEDITSGSAGTLNDLVAFGIEEGWLSAFDKRLAVFVSPRAGAETLYNFPIPVRMDMVGTGLQGQSLPLEVMAHPGNAFALTMYDGRTQCYGELEVSATPDSYACVVWISLRSIPQYGTHFYYYYASYAQPIFTSTKSAYVWDSNYLSVHHTEEDPSGSSPQMIDSTENDYDGTTEGTMLSEDSLSGNIGQSLDLDGSDDAVSLGTGAHGDLITVEAVIKNSDTSNVRAIVSKDDETAREFYLRQTSAGKLEMVAFTADVTSGSTVGGTTVGDGEYHHVVGVFDGSNVRVYVDGEEDNASPTALSGVIQTDDTATYIGKLPWASPVYGVGQIEEVRVSDSVRSAEWIRVTYKALFDLFLTFGGYTSDDPSTLEFPVVNVSQVFRTPASVQVSVNGVWRYVVRVQMVLNGAWKDLT